MQMRYVHLQHETRFKKIPEIRSSSAELVRACIHVTRERAEVSMDIQADESM